MQRKKRSEKFLAKHHLAHGAQDLVTLSRNRSIKEPQYASYILFRTSQANRQASGPGRKTGGKRASKKDKAVTQVRALMKKLGVSEQDLADRPARGRGTRKAVRKAVGKRKYGPVAPKYTDPKDRRNVDRTRTDPALAGRARGKRQVSRRIPDK